MEVTKGRNVNGSVGKDVEYGEGVRKHESGVSSGGSDSGGVGRMEKWWEGIYGMSAKNKRISVNRGRCGWRINDA